MTINWKEFYRRLLEKIREAEVDRVKYASSADKRQFVVDAIVGFLPSPWWLPMFVKRWVVGQIVDFAIFLFNRYWGKDWLRNLGNKF